MAGLASSPLALEARASQDTYGSGPQQFPYVGYFPSGDAWWSGGGEVPAPARKHIFKNLGFISGAAHDSVDVLGGTVYCGATPVSARGLTLSSSGAQAWLNIRIDQQNAFSAEVQSSPGGDLSIHLYTLTDTTLEDYVSGTMFIPYYN